MKTLKFITSLKTWSETSLDDDQTDLIASLLLSAQFLSSILFLSKISLKKAQIFPLKMNGKV